LLSAFAIFRGLIADEAVAGIVLEERGGGFLVGERGAAVAEGAPEKALDFAHGLAGRRAWARSRPSRRRCSRRSFC